MRSTALSRSVHRLPFLAGAILAALTGMYGGLALLLGGSAAAGGLAERHGPMMVFGFLGTLVCLERAVALRTGWAYAAPALGALGSVALAAAPGLPLGAPMLAGAAGWLVAVYVTLLRRRPGTEMALQLAGAVAWYAGGLSWLAGRGVPELVPWFAAFLVLTIAGERLELARIAFLTRKAAGGLAVACAVIMAGAVVSAGDVDLGWRLCGLGMLVTAGWLAVHDVARRTVRGRGAARYAAVCLLAGYVWLAVAGVVWTVAGLSPLSEVYDAAVHTLFLGFVVSMVFGHAPVILPAVLRVPLPYRRILYVPLVLLHVGLTIRVLGDLGGAGAARTTGGLLGVVALLVFAGCALAIVAAAVGRRRKQIWDPSR
ncbi:hypothetical protein AAH991_00655 [Microbispora sp. ZYX-F-249]|uniref:Uncharacterized protein n=1 Tax=Microbispora maris TaxID=3144104 RepID=A0ABV0AIE7_9ACTN